MNPNTSSRWPLLSVELKDASLRPSSPAEALRLAAAVTKGTLGGTGEAGDCVELQFNCKHAMVLYMRPDLTILRPHFPNRRRTGEGIEEFFCECCGVQLGDKADMLSRCVDREEGFLLCREILNGRLPNAVPLGPSDQSSIPGFDDQAAGDGVVEWVTLRSRRPAHAH
jgi:hypothetical protein